MTLQRLMALQDTLDDIGWIIIEPASNPFCIHHNCIELLLEHDTTQLQMTIFIYLANGLTGVTNDLVDVLYLEILQTNEIFYFEKINTKEWRVFLQTEKGIFTYGVFERMNMGDCVGVEGDNFIKYKLATWSR